MNIADAICKSGAAAACLLLLSCAASNSVSPVSAPPVSAPAPERPEGLSVANIDGGVRQWTSNKEGSLRLEQGPLLPLASGSAQISSSLPEPEEGDEIITLNPEQKFQSMVGFGASITDASAILILKALDEMAREKLMAELFSRDQLGISLVRMPIGASDFSQRHYSLDDMPAGQSDPELTRFTMAEPDVMQVPVLKVAKYINPELRLMASPWSAPGWMKDSDSLITGHLQPQYYDAFARYMARYLQSMEERELPVDWITIQNEPDFEPKDYPGMKATAPERAAIVGSHLGPLLESRNIRAKILDWDHNWDQPENPLAVLADPVANRYVSGVAWHCYGGDVAAMEQVRAAYPDKDVFFTECSGGEWAPDWGGSLGWMTENLVINATRNGSRGTLLWNLALDEKHGPFLGGCDNCRGVVTIDRGTGKYTRNVEYYVLGHVSRFVRPGAKRIASDKGAAITNVAFQNPDGILVLLAYNKSAQDKVLYAKAGSQAFRRSIAAGEVVTFMWKPD